MKKRTGSESKIQRVQEQMPRAQSAPPAVGSSSGRIFKNLQVQRQHELEELAAQQHVTGASVDRLIPIEQLLQTLRVIPIKEVRRQEDKSDGKNPGAVVSTSIEHVKVKRPTAAGLREATLALDTPARSVHMLKPATSRYLSSTPAAPTSMTAVASVVSSLEVVRECIAAPVFNLLLPGASPMVGVVDIERGVGIRSTYIPHFKSLYDPKYRACLNLPATRRTLLPHPIKGFEKAVVACMAMGETDPNLTNMGTTIDSNGELRVVKIDHGMSLMSTPQTYEELLYNVGITFFAPPPLKSPNYQPYVTEEIITFNPVTLKAEIDGACRKLDPATVEKMIRSRIELLEAQGVDFNYILKQHRYHLFTQVAHPGAELLGNAEVWRVHSKDDLVAFYVANIQRNKEMMERMSRDLGTIIERGGAEHLAPRDLINQLQIKDLIRQRDELLRQRGVSPERDASGITTHTPATAASVYVTPSTSPPDARERQESEEFIPRFINEATPDIIPAASRTEIASPPRGRAFNAVTTKSQSTGPSPAFILSSGTSTAQTPVQWQDRAAAEKVTKKPPQR